MGFDFIIKYKKGKENVMADFLSRREETRESNDEKSGGRLAAITQTVPNLVEAIKQEIESSVALQDLFQRIKDGEAIGPWKIMDRVIFFKEKIYLEENSSLIKDILEQFHNSTHEGYHKTFQRIRTNFFWKGMRSAIRKFIATCDICQ